MNYATKNGIKAGIGTIEAAYIDAKCAYAIAKAAYLAAVEALESADALGHEAAAKVMHVAGRAVREAYMVARMAHAEYIVARQAPKAAKELAMARMARRGWR